MSNSEGRYLNGTRFSNVTVVSECQDDGSIEASGILFVNTIKEYSIENPGVNIENCYFQAGSAIITSTEDSINKSTASLVVYGGTSILKNSNIYGILSLSNTSNSYNISDGSLIITGGIGLKQNLNMGGILQLFNTTPSYNKTSGSLITLGGISIQNTMDATSFTSGGGLTIDGGASIFKTLFANLIKSNNATIANANINNLLSYNFNSIYSNINSLTSSNIVSSNITSNTLYTNDFVNINSSISNLNLTYGTFGNIYTLNENISNSTINNLTTNIANINMLDSTFGNIESLTVGNLHVSNVIEYNDIVTNLSTANIINNFATISSLLLTNGTFGILYGSDLNIVNITNSNFLNTNLSSSNINIINETVSNSIINIASIGNLYVSNTYLENSTITNLFNINLTSNNAIITNTSINNLSSTYTTSGSLILSNTLASYASSIGTLISYGGIGVNITDNSTSYTNGGAVTIAGGLSIAKDLYVGSNVFTINISSKSLYTNISTIGSLNGNNIYYLNSTFNNLLLSGTNSSLNSSTGTLISYGGISINCTEDVTSISNGGSFTDAGGASIAKSLLVGGTISSSVISSGTLIVLNAILNNLSTYNITNSNLLNTNSTITNLNSINNTVNNLNASSINASSINTTSINTTSISANNSILSNISYGSLIGNYISANIITNNNTFTSSYSTISNLINFNSTISSLQLTNGTFGALYGSYLNINNATISSLVSTNILTLNETTTNLLSSNISTSNIISTNADFLYATISSLNVPRISIYDATISNLTLTNLTSSNMYVLYETIGSSLINNIINTNLTSNNSYLTNILNVNFTSSNSLIINITNTNLLSTNSTIISLIVTNESVSNLISNNSTISNLIGEFISTSNLITTNLTTGNINSLNAYILNISSSTILSDTLLIYNGVITNSTISNIFNTNLYSLNITNNNLLSNNASISNANIIDLTAGNINFTGTLYQNELPYISSQWKSIASNTIIYNSTSGNSYVGINTTSPNNSLDVIGSMYVSGDTVFNSSISAANLSINSNIIAQNITISNINSLFITNYSIYSNNISSINSTTNNLISSNIISTNSTIDNSIFNNITSTNLIVTNQSVSNLNSIFNTLGSLVTTNITASLNSTTASVILYGGLSVNSTRNATSFTSGGCITISGGIGILKDVYIGGYTWLTNNLDLNNNIITNVTSPNNLLDVANKWYVDTRFNNFTTGNVNGNFTQGQIIVASTGGNITGYSSFIFDNSINLLSLYGTQDATSLTDGGTLNIYGGASINKQLFVGGNAHILGYLDMNNQKITSVDTPTTFYDAANKYYVDNRFDNLTIGNVNGNFTQGQVIIANTGGNISGYSSFTFINDLLSLSNTVNSTNLTTPGALIVNGGVNILKTLFVGQGIDLNNKIISNVTSPSTLLDVANKYYVDNRFDNLTIGNVTGNFTQGQVIIANTGGNISGYSSFTFINGKLSILSTNNAINLTSGGVLSILGGATFNKNVYIGTGLDVNNSHITSVALPINSTDAVNKEYVDFFLGINNGDIPEKTFILDNNTNTPSNITGFSFANNKVSSFNSIVYLEIPTLNIYDQWNIHGVLKGSSWIINTTFIGDYPSKIVFSIINTGTTGQLQYTNINNSGIATIRFRASTTSQGIYTNITIGNIITSVHNGGTGVDFFTQGTLLIGDQLNSIKTTSNLMYFNDTLFLNNTIDATNFSTATAIFSGGVSIQKNLLIGTGVDLNMQKITNLAIPTSIYDAANKFYVDSIFSSGGSLNLNGYVTFNNTQDAVNISDGGTLTVYGGTSIAKQLYVGGITHFINTTSSTSTSNGSVIMNGGLGINGTLNGINSQFVSIITSNLNSDNISTSNLNVNNVNMVPSSGDIFQEIYFNASHNINTPSNITGFIFSNNVRYFTAWLSVFISATSNVTCAFTIEGLQINSGVWDINSRFIGKNIKINLSITNSGQIQYTCPEIDGFISNIMKFRAITTTV